MLYLKAVRVQRQVLSGTWYGSMAGSCEPNAKSIKLSSNDNNQPSGSRKQLFFSQFEGMLSYQERIFFIFFIFMTRDVKITFLC